MPESKSRKAADEKLKQKRAKELKEKRQSASRLAHDRAWVPWVFIPVGLLGVLWIVTFNLAGTTIPFIRDLGSWNVLIGLGLFMASFGIATLWK